MADTRRDRTIARPTGAMQPAWIARALTVAVVGAMLAAASPGTAATDVAADPSPSRLTLPAAVDIGVSGQAASDVTTPASSISTPARDGAPTEVVVLADADAGEGTIDAAEPDRSGSDVASRTLDHSSTDAAIITLGDTTAPVIACPSDPTISLGPGGNRTITAAEVGVTTSDEGGLASVVLAPNDVSATGAVAVTATATDESGNQSSCAFDVFVVAAASIEASLSVSSDVVPEPGGTVRLTYAVTNTSTLDVITLTGLDDSRFGDRSTRCVLPQLLGPGGRFECDLDVFFAGAPGDWFSTFVTATAADTEGNELTDASDPVTITISNVPPTINTITVSAASVDEGDTVTVTGTFSDPNPDGSTGSAVWSDGVETPVSVDVVAGTFSTSRTFDDDTVPLGVASVDLTGAVTIADPFGGAGTATSPVVTVSNADDDGDGIANDADRCPGTSLPDTVTADVKPNHYVADANGVFGDSGYTIEDTGGCSATQIIDAEGLGHGHSKFGLSRGVLQVWIASR